jgi:hypothetical protein
MNQTDASDVKVKLLSLIWTSSIVCFLSLKILCLKIASFRRLIFLRLQVKLGGIHSVGSGGNSCSLFLSEDEGRSILGNVVLLRPFKKTYDG